MGGTPVYQLLCAVAIVTAEVTRDDQGRAGPFKHFFSRFCANAIKCIVEHSLTTIVWEVDVCYSLPK